MEQWDPLMRASPALFLAPEKRNRTNEMNDELAKKYQEFLKRHPIEQLHEEIAETCELLKDVRLCRRQ